MKTRHHTCIMLISIMLSVCIVSFSCEESKRDVDERNKTIAAKALEVYVMINQNDFALGYRKRDLFIKTIGDLKTDQEFLAVLRQYSIRIVKWGDLKNKDGDTVNDIVMLLCINDKYYAFYGGSFAQLERDEVLNDPLLLPERFRYPSENLQ